MPGDAASKRKRNEKQTHTHNNKKSPLCFSDLGPGAFRDETHLGGGPLMVSPGPRGRRRDRRRGRRAEHAELILIRHHRPFRPHGSHLLRAEATNSNGGKRRRRLAALTIQYAAGFRDIAAWSPRGGGPDKATASAAGVVLGKFVRGTPGSTLTRSPPAVVLLPLLLSPLVDYRGRGVGCRRFGLGLSRRGRTTSSSIRGKNTCGNADLSFFFFPQIDRHEHSCCAGLFLPSVLSSAAAGDHGAGRRTFREQFSVPRKRGHSLLSATGADPSALPLLLLVALPRGGRSGRGVALFSTAQIVAGHAVRK